MGETRRIGFIGLGNMGMPMAANLGCRGHDVMAYDVAAERAHRFARAHAARATESLAELAGHAEIAITMLPTGREVTRPQSRRQARWFGLLSARG